MRHTQREPMTPGSSRAAGIGSSGGSDSAAARRSFAPGTALLHRLRAEVEHEKAAAASMGLRASTSALPVAGLSSTGPSLSACSSFAINLGTSLRTASSLLLPPGASSPAPPPARSATPPPGHHPPAFQVSLQPWTPRTSPAGRQSSPGEAQRSSAPAALGGPNTGSSSSSGSQPPPTDPHAVLWAVAPRSLAFTAHRPLSSRLYRWSSAPQTAAPPTHTGSTTAAEHSTALLLLRESLGLTAAGAPVVELAQESYLHAFDSSCAVNGPAPCPAEAAAPASAATSPCRLSPSIPRAAGLLDEVEHGDGAHATAGRQRRSGGSGGGARPTSGSSLNRAGLPPLPSQPAAKPPQGWGSRPRSAASATAAVAPVPRASLTTASSSPACVPAAASGAAHFNYRTEPLPSPGAPLPTVGPVQAGAPRARPHSAAVHPLRQHSTPAM